MLAFAISSLTLVLGTVGATPAPDVAAAAALAAASPTPIPQVQFTTRFVQGDTNCAFTSSTLNYPYGTCNNIGAPAYSWQMTAPVGTTAYVYSGVNCTGHLETYAATDTTCHAPKFNDGTTGTTVQSFVVPGKNCWYGC